jgi:hypothetical protein
MVLTSSVSEICLASPFLPLPPMSFVSKEFERNTVTFQTLRFHTGKNILQALHFKRHFNKIHKLLSVLDAFCNRLISVLTNLIGAQDSYEKYSC